MVVFHVVSERGVRPVNEDQVHAREVVRGGVQGVFAVCDGAGPDGRGTEASRMACETLGRTLLVWLEGAGTHPGYDEAERQVREAFAEAHMAIREHVNAHPVSLGISSTCVLTVTLGTMNVDGEDLVMSVVAGVGDARCYAIGKKMTPLLPVPAGDAPPPYEIVQGRRGARVERRRGIPALGIGEVIEPNIRRVNVSRHVRLLLCTEGLTLHLEDDEIFSIVKSAADLESAGSTLTEEAMSRGGAANISFILLQRDDFERG